MLTLNVTVWIKISPNEIFEKFKIDGCFTYDTHANIEYKDAIRVLRDEGYINNHNGGYRFILLFKGSEVISQGGWDNHKKIIAKRKRISEAKERYEHGISKFKYYTFWPALILGIVGGIYSVFDIIKTYKEDNQTITKSLSEQTKPHILSEAQKK